MRTFIKILTAGPQEFTAIPVSEIKRIEAKAETGIIKLTMKDKKIYNLEDLTDKITVINLLNSEDSDTDQDADLKPATASPISAE